MIRLRIPVRLKQMQNSKQSQNSNLDHTVYVTYKNLADETEQLVKDLQALKSSKTDANVKATCETFLEARAWWEKSEAFLYGAATDFGIDPHIDSWPLDLDGLQTALKKYGTGRSNGW